MKKIIFFLLLSFFSQAQINVVSADNGSVTIEPYGIRSKFPNGYNPLNIALGEKSLFVVDQGLNNVALGYHTLKSNYSASGNVAIGNLAMEELLTDGIILSTHTYNTAVGFKSLYNPYIQVSGQNLLGAYNTAIGAFALADNYWGYENTGVGLYALYKNSHGKGNTGLGNNTLYTNTTGDFNTAIGKDAMYNSNGASNNVAVGASAMFYNVTGIGNTALGNTSLYFNTGNYNTALGSLSAYNNKGGASNTSVGESTLYHNKFGNSNVALGNLGLFNNTYASKNIAIGHGALYSQSFANNNVVYDGHNVAVGYNSQNNTNPINVNNEFFFGLENTSVGNNSLLNNTNGSGNVALGFGAGDVNSIGSNNTYLGYNANSTGNSFSNSTAIGFNATVNASNKIRLGNANVTVVEGPVAYTFPSDKRLKENIVQTQIGLEFIQKLKTVSYSYIADKTQQRHDGLIAQEVEDAIKSTGQKFSAVKISDNGSYSLAYSDFVMPLINAVKELSLKIDQLDTEKKYLETKVLALEAMLSKDGIKAESSTK